jgi:hypothetical protein
VRPLANNGLRAYHKRVVGLLLPGFPLPGFPFSGILLPQIPQQEAFAGQGGRISPAIQYF